jgi:ParB family chromosome partitioning protein
MSNKKSALGKGLSALLENANTDVTSKGTVEGVVGSIAQIPLNQIEPNPFQPRSEFDSEKLAELATSIKEQGIIQPITVRKLGYDRYQIISGERRFKASTIAGLMTIPAYVRIANDQGMLELALIENIQRENLNPIEIAISFKRLIDECTLTQEQLSERLGKSRSNVTNTLRLLKLPPDIQAAVRDEKISMGHARSIVGMDDVVKQIWLFEEILKNQLSVRETEELARGISKVVRVGKKKNTKNDSVSIEVNKIQKILTDHFNSKVKVQRSGSGKGKIVISYNDNEDFNRILELINY